ncbi:hypothetical protein GJ744_005816 [Endocarpon pusillum]|uniref:Short chain dehydrogenase/reductase family n=1 Tax=Endocarpon pusillum TaxID=364733 RepID=A0A8H7A5B8_9EURO|nr:hypothetical protein GJ744_005816 [Endocarpon pusillum]
MAFQTPDVDVKSLFNVKGLIAVITGGGSGLGAMMARALDANGASRVFIVGRREEQLKQTAATGRNGNIVPLVGDVTSKESLQKIVDQVSTESDHLDVLICNSGSSGPRSFPPPKEDGSPATLAEIREFCWNVPMEEFEQANMVNITGVWYSCLAFMPLLEATNKMRPAPSTLPRPQIITTSSIGAFNRVPLGGFAYTASKAGVVHLMKSMATLLGKFDIRCNVIAPGVFYSEMSAPTFQHLKIENGHEESKFDRNIIPATRSGHEEDMAGVILWLCSKAGAYISGNVVVSDGGRLGVFPSSY